MSQKLPPYELRDFHGGRYAPYGIDASLCPEYTVSDCLNVDFDTRLGAATVRKGTTKIGATIASNKTPLGASKFVTKKGTIYSRIITTYSGASNATVYYYNGTWTASNLTSLNNTARTRFSMLGNQMFIVNGQDVMRSSSDGGATWSTTNCIDGTGTIKPSLITTSKARVLVSGATGQSPSRVYFSSIVDPTTSPGTITFSTNATTGNYIDINPDDGDYVTALENTSTYTLVFKNNAMYRLDVINKSVDTDNIFNIGAPSQEAIITVQGVTYFFSGIDIRQTTGDFPQQISRLGVQDYVDAIPQSQWTSVYAFTDGLNAYWSIGTITLNKSQDSEKTLNNVVLKFSPRDQAWTVRSYANNFKAFTNIATATLPGFALVGFDTAGQSQQLNQGNSDNGSAIFFDLWTQEITNGIKAHTKTISDQIAVYVDKGIDSSLELYPDDRNVVKIPSIQNLNRPINIGQNINVSYNALRFRWFGNASNTQPVFRGIYVENTTDDGLI